MLLEVKPNMLQANLIPLRSMKIWQRLLAQLNTMLVMRIKFMVRSLIPPRQSLRIQFGNPLVFAARSFRRSSQHFSTTVNPLSNPTQMELPTRNGSLETWSGSLLRQHTGS